MLSKHIRYRCAIERFVIASKLGGSSSDGFYEKYKGTYPNLALAKLKASNKLKGYTIVTNEKEARHCLEILMADTRNRIVACDTETIDLDPKKEAPVGNGRIVCASIFAGPELDFGSGPRLFIDNFGENSGLLDIFKPYFESKDYLKCWHNYGFDRHVFYNHGINVQGLGGDTMHMARLFDSSNGPKEYSLARLTENYKKQIQIVRGRFLESTTERLNKLIEGENDPESRKKFAQQLANLATYEREYSTSSLKKVKLDELFKRKKTLISGGEGKSYEFPSVLTMHTSAQYITEWVKYSVLDSQSTFFLRQTLEYYLKIQKSNVYEGFGNMWEVYQKYWRPFGEILTDMERQGIKIDLQHMENIKIAAIKDSQEKKATFMKYLSIFIKDPNVDLFNLSSSRQMQQLLYAPFVVEKKQENVEEPEQFIEEDLEFGDDDIIDGKLINRKVLTELPAIDELNVRNDDPKRGNKSIKLTIEGLGIPPVKLTPAGLPSVDGESLKLLAGRPKDNKYGKAYEYLSSVGKAELGKQLCQAIDTLVEYRNIQTLLKTFIEPLKDHVDRNSRIHCSLNINTETGRLSARKPNLQNQPALEKDIYKIRQAFQAEKGKKFIVADYGQLQLRVLAHITNCKAMISAFEQGGDFHSRTAMGMFPHIKKEVDEGKLLLEWDNSKGKAPAELLKNKYASERRKAKTMNFSIAYGKTAHGFAQDWNCSMEEANQSLEAWFREREQVRKWQNEKKKIAQVHKLTQTLLGRFRYLHKYFSVAEKARKSMRNMAMRRAINTPIQGGAADIVIAAMVKIHDNDKLRQLGWKLLLQIHDQLILEGPEQTSKEALAIVKQLMENPLPRKLLVALQVDAKIGDNWYECK